MTDLKASTVVDRCKNAQEITLNSGLRPYTGRLALAEALSLFAVDMPRQFMLEMPQLAMHHHGMKRELFLNGLPDLVILRLLASREMYGYEIVAKISLISREVLNFGEGCIYPILHRMVADGFLLQRQAMVDGRQRRYYRLSSSGHKQLAAHNRRWEEVCHAVKAIESI